MRQTEWQASPGFLLLLAFLFYLDEDGLLFPALLAAACHEGGHALAVKLWGGRVRAVRLTCVGAEMRMEGTHLGEPLPALTCALAGPAVNVLLAALSARLAGALGAGAWLFAGLNLALGAFNLLPVEALDGGRALRALLPRRRWAEGLCRGLSALLALALSGCGLWLMAETANPTLFLTGAWLALLTLGTEKSPCNRGEGVIKYQSLKKGAPLRGRQERRGIPTHERLSLRRNHPWI